MRIILIILFSFFIACKSKQADQKIGPAKFVMPREDSAAIVKFKNSMFHRTTPGIYKIYSAVGTYVFWYHQKPNQILINKNYYTLVFDTAFKRPVYLQYQFTGKNFNHTWTDAILNYDLYLTKAQQWGYRYYPETEYYDKGHLIPKEDMRFDSIAAAECNVYSNVAPQEYHVNRGVWKSLENYVRKKAFLLKDTITVWTGCIYGAKKIVWLYVPSYFWKVIAYKENGKLIIEAYLVSNRKPIKATIESKKVSTQQIEKITGLNF